MVLEGGEGHGQIERKGQSFVQLQRFCFIYFEV